MNSTSSFLKKSFPSYFTIKELGEENLNVEESLQILEKGNVREGRVGVEIRRIL